MVATSLARAISFAQSIDSSANLFWTHLRRHIEKSREHPLLSLVKLTQQLSSADGLSCCVRFSGHMLWWPCTFLPQTTHDTRYCFLSACLSVTCQIVHPMRLGTYLVLLTAISLLSSMVLGTDRYWNMIESVIIYCLSSLWWLVHSLSTMLLLFCMWNLCYVMNFNYLKYFTLASFSKIQF